MNATEQLCIHDPRNEDGCACADADEPCPGRTDNCSCDNCFYGRDELAREILDQQAIVLGVTDAMERVGAMRFSPIEVAVAISLYGYNVPPGQRAQKILDHFSGNCAEPDELLRLCTDPAYAATEFAYPTACVYVDHALQRYGSEARERVAANADAVRRFGF